MPFDFEVIQHLSAILDREARQIHLPALRLAIVEGRGIIAAGRRWRPQRKEVVFARMAKVSRIIEQISLIEHELSAVVEYDADAMENLRFALHTIDEECRRLENDVLFIVNRAASV
jgi:hypothetical protein